VIQPGNYGTHFREWVRAQGALAKHPRNEPYRIAYELTKKAQYFQLPEGGRILEDSNSLDAKFGLALRLPFPVTAFEFHRECNDGAISTKSISLCFEHDQLNQCEFMQQGQWGCMAVAYMDEMGVWAVIPGIAIYVPGRAHTVTATDSEKSQGVAAGIRRTGLGCDTEPVGHRIIVPKLFHFAGHVYPSDFLMFDLQHEFISAIQACAALACVNVAARSEEPSLSLNAKRARLGREPFNSYRVLEVVGARTSAASRGGQHASPRRHLRRGHIRHLDSERTTWVSSCVVGNKALGVVTKDYRMASAGVAQ
jgi:hypothetical protein